MVFQTLTHADSPVVRLASRLRWVPAALFVVAVPVFLVTGSLTWAFNNIGLYEAGFEKYRISLSSGINTEDLRQVAVDLRSYFNSGEEPLSVRAPIYGVERDLFNDKEVHHMADVKRLLWGVYALFGASAVCLVGLTTLGLARHRQDFLAKLAFRAATGGALTIGLLVAFGLVALVGFDALFLLFHKVSFANDLWRLDPRTDYLVLLFPQGFWFDATMWVALRSIAGGGILAAAGGAYLAWRRWKEEHPDPGASKKKKGSVP